MILSQIEHELDHESDKKPVIASPDAMSGRSNPINV